jgi:hypothetical protein
MFIPRIAIGPYQILGKYPPCAEIILLLFYQTDLFMYVGVQTIVGVSLYDPRDPDAIFPLAVPVTENWHGSRISGSGP